MNLEDYRVETYPQGRFVFRHVPSGAPLLVTEGVSLDTLVRIAVTDHAKRKNISLES